MSDKRPPLDLSPFEDLPEQVVVPSSMSTESGEDFLLEEYLPMSQYKGQYILVPVKSGLMWIHQRRAHIRVLYEKYRKQLQERNAPVQGVLFPERVELTLSESTMLDSISEDILSLGFDVSSLGGGTYVIQGVPSGLDGLSPVKLLMEVLHAAMEQTADAKERLYDKLANAMAKEVAIVAGQVLSFDEMKSLVDELFRTPLPSRTPDGRAILYIMSDNDIDRLFIK